MSIKNKEQVNVYQRLDMMEKQLKKLSMLDEYVKQILEMEKRLSQLNKLDKTKGLEKRLVPLLEETVKSEFAPVQYAYQELYKRIISLEKKMSALETWADETTAEMDSRNEEARVHDPDHSVLFQEITVEKLFVDKYEQVNNVGSLGVKELSGQMNIGATFENSSNPSEGIPEEPMEKWQEKKKKFKAMKEKYGIDKSNENNRGADKEDQRNEVPEENDN
ncbi:MAG TPA: hypothetical protein DEO65_01475 [Bacillus bacterium]|uniref:Uncharacterized protein n=1 Tax=Siminovitchia fordii TaxID=254759 RepID=A0ABQ4K585_9BACI|nr:hypothetical protein [Siminovitchia fordii]GIN20879.1 hypothetical protein J1TS3_20130 [Siminovitchia fordii]HBZ08537.1 hypothetical protein [Bacillus sp. (in: firmicutes)]